MSPITNKFANEVAAAAPEQPNLSGQAHNAVSPMILTIPAMATIFRGLESF